MQSRELANRITEIIVDKQGEDILILDLTEVTTFTDYFILCTAGSFRQLDALHSAVQEELKRSNIQRLAAGSEAGAESGWVLLDYNSVIVHLFTQEMREFYRLEELWNNARIVTHIQ